MAIEINITPEQINDLVSKSIMEAAIGKKIREHLDKALGGYELQKIITDAIQWGVTRTVADHVQEKYKDLIQASCIKSITAEVVEKATEQIASRILRY